MSKTYRTGLEAGLIVLVLSLIGAAIFLNHQLVSSVSAWSGPVPNNCKDVVGNDQVVEGCVVEDLPGKNCADTNASGQDCNKYRAVGYLSGCGSYGSCSTGSVCIGCASGIGSGQGLYGVTNVNVKRTTPGAALVSWSYGPGRVCTKRGSTIIFIGTDQSKVAANCGFKGISVINDNSPLPAGCSWVRKVSSSATSYNTTVTSAGVQPIFLDGKTTYYFKVVTRYFFTDSSGEDSGSFCGAGNFILPTPKPTVTPTPRPTVTPTCTPTPTPVICKNCQYQVDLFWGPVIQSFASGIRYTTSKNHRLINSTNNYSNLPGCKLDPAPILPDPILPVFTSECSDPANKGYLTGSISTVNASSPKGYITGTVKNSSAHCTYTVGLASYKANGSNVNIQNLFDSKSITLGPGQSAQINVGSPMVTNAPSCHNLP